MLASFPASLVNQKPADLGIQNRFNLTTSRFSRTSGYFSAKAPASFPIAVCEKSRGALIRNLPRGLFPPEAIAAAVSSSSASSDPVRS